MRRLIRFTILLCLLFLSCTRLDYKRTPASIEQHIDIVFDLDWTLVSEITDELQDPKHNPILIGDEKYRVANFAEEILERLSEIPGVRISFYSGGSEKRNLELLQKIILPNKQMSAYQLAHKILSKKDMLEVSQDPNLKFADRLKKDLTKINPNLENIILIDDVHHFTPLPQRDNILWLGPTFNHYDSYELAQEARTKNLADPYIPTSRSQWRLSQDKLIVIYGIIAESIEEMEESGKTFKEAIIDSANEVHLGSAIYNREVDKLVNKYLPNLTNIQRREGCLRLINPFLTY